MCYWQKVGWYYSVNLKIRIPYDPTLLFLSMSKKLLLYLLHKLQEIYTPLFMEIVYVIEQNYEH